MALEPAGFRVLVKPDAVEEKSEGGIYIVQDEKLARAAQILGTLVKIGEQAWKAFGKDHEGAAWAKEGDRVYYARHAGKNITDPTTGEEYLIMNDDDIVAVVREEG